MNASGKSNFGFALFDLVSLLTDKKTHPLRNDRDSFLNAASESKCATFEYTFRKNKDTIVYIYKKKSPILMLLPNLNVQHSNILLEKTRIL